MSHDTSMYHLFGAWAVLIDQNKLKTFVKWCGVLLMLEVRVSSDFQSVFSLSGLVAQLQSKHTGRYTVSSAI